MTKIIAIDFDGTLCKNAWPRIGDPNWRVIDAAIREKMRGTKLILWTCREGDELAEALAWADRRALIFDAVNENLPECIERYGNDCRKVHADEYWDDKGVPVIAGRIRVGQGG